MSGILEDFEADCAAWYGWGDRGRNDSRARIEAYKALTRRHGSAAVSRHWRAIMGVLDRAELQYARGHARDILSVGLE